MSDGLRVSRVGALNSAPVISERALLPGAALIFALSLALSHLLPAALVAAPAVRIDTLNVDILPEHDDPRVLIIYRGTLSANAPPPYPLAFTIPAEAQVHAAAYRRDAQLYSAQYETGRDGDRTRVTFPVPVRDFQFEYYADAISGRPQRSFGVGVVFPLPVENLQVSVEQPLRSSGFTLTPAAARTAVSGAFTYFLYSVDRWPAGKAWSIRGTYRKEDSDPSLTRPAAQSAPVPPTVPSPRAEPLLWLLPAVIGIVLGVAGALTVTYLRRPRTPRRGPPGRTAPVARRRDRESRQERRIERRHCANCGTRAEPRDRFCRRCGRPLPEL